MARRKKIKMHKFKLLNPVSSHNTGWIKYSVECGRKENSADIVLKLADCNRVIDLSLDGWNEEDRSNSVKKVNILIDSLIQLRDTILKVDDAE